MVSEPPVEHGFIRLGRAGIRPSQRLSIGKHICLPVLDKASAARRTRIGVVTRSGGFWVHVSLVPEIIQDREGFFHTQKPLFAFISPCIQKGLLIMRHILIAAGIPAAVYPQFEHISPLLPADVLARYFRLRGDRVIFVSGTPCHGSAVTLYARSIHCSSREVSEESHRRVLHLFDKLNFSADLCTAAYHPQHVEFMQDFFKTLLSRAQTHTQDTATWYCPHCEVRLPSSTSDGLCPLCAFPLRQHSVPQLYLGDLALSSCADWGIPLLQPGFNDHCIDAVIDHIMIGCSAAQKVCCAYGLDPDAFLSGSARHYYVCTDEDLPLYTQTLPALLTAHGGLHLPDAFIAWALPDDRTLSCLQNADEIRYTLLRKEKTTPKEYKLFIQCCFSMLSSCRDDNPGSAYIDSQLAETVSAAFERITRSLEHVQVREAFAEVLALCDLGGHLRSDTDRRWMGSVLALLTAPFLPDLSSALFRLSGSAFSGWALPPVR